MQRTSALLAVCFCAGLIAALFNSLAAWLGGAWGITTLAGVSLAPEFTKAWLYPRLVWGGIWGLTYFISVRPLRQRCHWVRKGLWFSLLPTTAQLFFIFPQSTPHGLLGLGLGALTPIFVIFYNLIWGFFTGVFARLLWGRG
jgi:hypothetical protein